MLSLFNIIIVAIGFIAINSIKIYSEWEKGVILRFGRFVGIRGPGLFFIIPFVEKAIKVDTRVVTMDIKPQDVITKDNVSLKVNAVVYFRVLDPKDAIIQVENYYFATSQLAQTTLRSVLGQYSLDSLLSEREKINQTLQDILDKATEPWGIKVSVVEVKHIDLPKDMQKAMAREAEAERERRAKIISAQGEEERSQKLLTAAQTIEKSPAAVQLAYLHSLSEITGDKSTIIFPIPMEILKAFSSLKESVMEKTSSVHE